MLSPEQAQFHQLCHETQTLLLRRLAYPCRYLDIMARFGRPAPVLSMRTNEVLDFIYTNHSHRILQGNPAILQPVKLEENANAIQIKGGALDNCFGFIDGTVRPKLEVVQFYNYRLSRLLFVCLSHVVVVVVVGFFFTFSPETVFFCCFLIVRRCCFSEGRKHDSGMLADSGLLHQLQLHATSPLGQPMCIFGDPAYPLRVQLQGPYKNAVVTPAMQVFNTSMSQVRIAVEWLFGDIVNYFKFTDTTKT